VIGAGKTTVPFEDKVRGVVEDDGYYSRLEAGASEALHRGPRALWASRVANSQYWGLMVCIVLDRNGLIPALHRMLWQARNSPFEGSGHVHRRANE